MNWEPHYTIASLIYAGIFVFLILEYRENMYECKDCGKIVRESRRLRIRATPLPDETEARYIYKCPKCRGPLRLLVGDKEG